MTRDDVIRMVREIADKTTVDPVHGDPPLIVVSPDEMIRFAALVAAAEREACKALHELDDVLAHIGNGTWGESYQQGWTDGTWAYLQAIRARGEV
jgi:hypothetical protein